MLEMVELQDEMKVRRRPRGKRSPERVDDRGRVLAGGGRPQIIKKEDQACIVRQSEMRAIEDLPEVWLAGIGDAHHRHWRRAAYGIEDERRGGPNFIKPFE